MTKVLSINSEGSATEVIPHLCVHPCSGRCCFLIWQQQSTPHANDLPFWVDVSSTLCTRASSKEHPLGCVLQLWHELSAEKMDATAVKPKYYLWGKSAVMETAADMLLGMVPIWVAVAVGLLVGWSWKPQWASILLMGIKSRPRLIWGTPPGFGARRFWLAIMAVSAFPMWKEAWKSFSAWMWPTPDVLIVPADFSSGVVGPW